MRRPPRWFEKFVRVTFPGGALANADVRLLIVWAFPVVAVLGLGLGMVGLSSDHRSGVEVIGGVVILVALMLVLLAYGLTLRYIVRVDRERPDGRHAQR